MLSTFVMAAGWLVNIWVAYTDGIDTSLVGILTFIGIAVCGLFAMLVGALVFYASSRSQRAADIAFSGCMILLGLVLAAIPAV